MEIVNTVLAILAMVVVLGLLWVLPIVGGLRCAKRNSISPHWMWFGIHPLGGWIAFAVICSAKTERVGDALVRWSSGKISCYSCGKFNSINNAHCAKCRAKIIKPICPRCKSDSTRYVSQTGQYIVSGFAGMIMGGCLLNSLQNTGVPDGQLTWEELLMLVPAIVLLLAGTVMFFWPLSKSTKRIRCSSCGAVSPAATVVAFQQPSTGEDRRE
jgi:predicted RNA-binding Zn-ribbon protein involved in translation (DUF1610 family)